MKLKFSKTPKGIAIELKRRKTKKYKIRTKQYEKKKSKRP